MLPEGMNWDPALVPSYIMLGGVTLRYLKVGDGPVLVLLHTLRTQLDLFHKVIPDLARDFTVYALDYPGHGYSEIPEEAYDAGMFVNYVDRFIEELGLTEVTLAGVSIGASISLKIAARRNPRVVRIIPMNPYDYDQGKGMGRSSWVGRVLVSLAPIPFVGDTVMRLRSFIIFKAVMSGGVTDRSSISHELMKEMYRAGNRRGHYRAFISLLRNSSSWERAASEYGNINIPTLLIWGDDDWSLADERRRDESLIPAVQSITVQKAGHFLPLDAPAEVVHYIRSFAPASREHAG